MDEDTHKRTEAEMDISNLLLKWSDKGRAHELIEAIYLFAHNLREDAIRYRTETRH